jgi:hypothetical protein
MIRIGRLTICISACSKKKSEVESSLLSAAALHSSYNRILLTLPPESRPTSEELSSTRTELKATLSTLIYDISELDHVVRVLEQDLSSSSSSSSPTSSKKNINLNKSKFGVSLDEVKKRRAWLVEVQEQVKVRNPPHLIDRSPD